MKTIVLTLTLSISFMNFANEPKLNDVLKIELKVNNENDVELQNIEKSGKSFYDWLFKEDFVYLGVIQDKNKKCLLDTPSYFNKLKKMGTISEKFVLLEKERLNECAQYISTIKYKKYMKAEAYEYADHCVEFYSWYWAKGQTLPDSYAVKNVQKINATQATMDIYLNYGGFEELSTRIFLDEEEGMWKITAVNFIE